MIDKEENQEETSAEENLKGVGQQILGNIEIVGGVLTGDPLTTAEGEFNASVGAVHQESSNISTESERKQKINQSDEEEGL